MATDNIARYGFRWHSSRGGATSPHLERVRVASGYGGVDANSAHVDVNVGDPVCKVNDGTVRLAQLADSIFGIVANILPYSKGDGIRPYTKLVYASTGTIGTPGELCLEVIPVADQIFEVDCDDASSLTTIATYSAAIGENVDHVLTGDTTATSAKPQLDISTHNTTNTLHWRIVDISPTSDNQDPAGANFKLLVTANLVQQAPWTILGV